MNCPSCQAANSDGARFCQNCGTPLTMVCPHCGTSLAAGARFCHHCGHQLAPTPPGVTQAVTVPTMPPVNATTARLQQYIPKELLTKLEAARRSKSMEGERRIVTILFCDVKGSTALAEQLDPEEWAEIMNGAFKYLIEPVYRYEGTLARLMGDGILAFFGAPIAHEDDPRRAVLAGLQILETIQDYGKQIKQSYGFDFDVRIGINTGLVVVGEIGSDLRVEYTAMGDAVNLAARMEQTARPGTVQITENTYRLVAPLFEIEPLGGIDVKGKAEPASAYRVIRPRAGVIPTRGIAGLHSPLVGRDRELATLRGCADELLAGRGQIVSVMGEAGLGKSRLVAELRESLHSTGLLLGGEPEPDATAHTGVQPVARWCEGRSFSYQRNTPYAPLVDMLNAYFALERADPDAENYGRVQQGLVTIMAEQGAGAAPYMAMLLGIRVPPEEAESVRYLDPLQLRERIFGATADFLERLASIRPLVLVFEDLHWADQTSLDLLERLLPLTERASVMILALFRKRRDEPSWRFHELAAREYAHRYTSITLAPLDADCSRTLVANLLHIEDLPDRVRALILDKAEGNPFFVEEVIRSLLDAKLVVRENSHWRATREINTIGVPDTLVGVITARLDRLDEEVKRVAQTAAVIGREFSFDALVDVYDGAESLDPALTDLQRREVVRERSRVPQRWYLFKHVLTQETAYASILLSRRRTLHRRTADCLERLYPERINDIARHLLEAKEHRRALPYLIAAGEEAMRAYAIPEAIAYFTRALEILPADDDSTLARRAYEGLGGSLMLSNDLQAAAGNYQNMLDYARAHGDVPMEVSALNKRAQPLMWLGQFAESEAHLVEAERLARTHGDLAGLAELCTIRCGVYNMSGNFEGAAKYLNESVRVGQALNKKEQMVFGLTHIAVTLTYMTHFEEAWQKAQEAWQLAEELGDRLRQAELLAWQMSWYHLRNGDLDAARASADQGLQLSQRIGVAFDESIAAYMLGLIAQLRGEYEQAVAFYRRAREAGRKSGYAFMEVIALAALGTAYLDIGEEFLAEANEAHAGAERLLQHPSAQPAGGTAWANLGSVRLARGDVEHAAELFHRGITIPTTLGLLQRPVFLIGLARVALARGQFEEAARLVDEGWHYAEERAMKHLYPALLLARAEASTAQGETERALEQYERAAHFATKMRMRPALWRAHADMARLLLASGRPAEAARKWHEAEAVIDEIVALFEDSRWRSIFIKNARRGVD